MRRAAAPPARAVRADNLPAAGEQGNENAGLGGELCSVCLNWHIQHLCGVL